MVGLVGQNVGRYLKMDKLYFRPKAERHMNSRCIYYSSLGTLKHLKVDMRQLYREIRETETETVGREEVMISMLANPICTIRKASEL